jgi:hypothetical protein
MKSTRAAEPVLVEPESAAGTSLLGSFSGVGTSSPSKDPADSSKTFPVLELVQVCSVTLLKSMLLQHQQKMKRMSVVIKFVLMIVQTVQFISSHFIRVPVISSRHPMGHEIHKFVLLVVVLKPTAHKSQIRGCNFYYDILKDRFIDLSVMLINYATSDL